MVLLAPAIVGIPAAAAGAALVGRVGAGFVPSGARMELAGFGREGCNKDDTTIGVYAKGTRLVAGFRGLRAVNGPNGLERVRKCAIQLMVHSPEGWRFTPLGARVAGTAWVDGKRVVRASTTLRREIVDLPSGSTITFGAADSGALWSRQQSFDPPIAVRCVPTSWLSIFVGADAAQPDGPQAPAAIEISRWDMSLSDFRWQKCGDR
ncbi:DUF4360 domain-containing protein [Pilimelia terevasa]|uniref:DUF4360 domain-containing protein n=1 Tax=Pilimelia terevasa TaxID=53372 RepID=UPI00166DC2D4|nr:DUF4360 domain-containing protein [Pilimelia terevasa]